MTTTDIRGYIPHAPAKSGVGIGTPDIETVHNRASGFFMR
ncbi:ash family protein [Salmonella enterica subsp. enterica serovar Poona]|nr:ash family protein [Salmonella enterica subsp. enterica serovar Poona]